jgi:hypothetical protein
MGDVDGDGLADVCARGAAGVLCWPSTGTGFGDPITGPELTDELGFTDVALYSTIRLADVTGDGKDDVCARSATDYRCWPSTGTGFAAPFAIADISDDAGWNAASKFGTIVTGDVDGDGVADVCGRAPEGMRCWASSGSDFGAAIAGPEWSDALGWSALKHWSTIRLADVDGDGRGDLCARSSTGFACHLSTGDGFGPAITGPALSDEAGWSDQANYLTFRMADVDGDGRADLCARADDGVHCWRSTGGGFDEGFAWTGLADAGNWFSHKYFRTMRLADIDGDAKADLCARAAKGFLCWASSGDGFGAEIAGPVWSDEKGWGVMRFYGTIRAAGPKPLVKLPAPGEGGGAPTSGSGSSSGSAADAVAGAGGSSGVAAGGGGGDPAEPGAEAVEGGCSCRAAGGSARSPWAAIAASAALARRRRRGRALAART